MQTQSEPCINASGYAISILRKHSRLEQEIADICREKGNTDEARQFEAQVSDCEQAADYLERSGNQ